MEDIVELDVTFTQQQVVETNKWLLSLEVIRNAFLPAEIFVFQRDLQGQDTFQAVATPVQIDTFRANIPNEGQVFWRKASVSLEFDTLTQLNEAEAFLRSDIQLLVNDQQKLLTDPINTTETVTFTGNDAIH